MKSIFKAFRDALVADANLTAVIPATSIFAGARDEKNPIPCIDILVVSGATTRQTKTGWMSAEMGVQVSIFAQSEDTSQTVKDLVLDVLLSDNTVLNNAGVRNVRLQNEMSLKEYGTGLSHYPMRFKCQYVFTVP